MRLESSPTPLHGTGWHGPAPGVGPRDAEPGKRPLRVRVDPGDAERAGLRHTLLVGLFVGGEAALLEVEEHPPGHALPCSRGPALPQRLSPRYGSVMDRIALGLMPLRDASPRDVVGWSQQAEALGFEAVFISESYGDSLAYAEAVALATDRLRVGTAITNVYLRQPTLLAEQAAAAPEFSV